MITAQLCRPVRSFLLLVCSFGLTLGCNDSAQQASSSSGNGSTITPPPQQRLPANAPVGPTAPVAPANAPAVNRPATPAPGAPTVSMPAIPKDAKWTIYCFAVQQSDKVPNPVIAANAMRDALVSKTGRSDWYVIHGSGQSNLYFGFYSFVSPEDRKSVDVLRGEQDLQLVQDLRSIDGTQPFRSALFVSLDVPDPTAPPEWNLFNVDRNLAPKDPKRAYWSLQIMAFRGVPERKEAAVEAVRTLRAQGVDAYYYHGDTISSVCVGRWPSGAIKEQKLAPGARVDQNATLLISSEFVPDNLKPKSLDGKQTLLVSPKIEITDPTLKAMQAKFPHHATNYVEGRIVDGKPILDPSFIVTVPRAKGNGLYDSDLVVDPYPTRQEPFRRPAASMIPGRQ